MDYPDTHTIKEVINKELIVSGDESKEKIIEK